MSGRRGIARLASQLAGLLVALVLLAGCSVAPTPAASPTAEVVAVVATHTVVPTAVPSDTPVPSATPTLTSTPTVTPSHTPTATVTPSATPTATPDPYAGLTIADLMAREYGEGELVVEQVLGRAESFSRMLISYPSDGLQIAGFMNVPNGEGPFPVAIVLHGYIDPEVYTTLAYTTRYADALAQAGYLVLHPNLRGYPPSDSGPNDYRVGMAIDTLNLIGLVRKGAQGNGPLAQADGERIGLMGHSMGGGITIRVITVDQGIRAAVLYGSMNADERINYEQVKIWSGGTRGHEELEIPEADLRRISPVTYLDQLTAAVSIHHSLDDQTVPPEWSEELAARLQELGKDVEHFTYSGTPHTFRGEADQLFMQRMIAFFDEYVKG